MLQLKQLRVEGFRGYPAAIDTVEFATPAVLLYGDNHQSKSSLLNAIEWCLYGDQCIGSKSGIRERIGWEIVNRNAAQATVELAVETDEGVVAIKRVEAKGKGKRGKTIEIRFADGLTKSGSEAEQEITQLIGLSFRDFATTVYQHQETIRDIVTQEPKDRNDAIDRLLGLSDYRNVLEGVRKSKVSGIAEELRRQRDELAAHIEQAFRLRQNDLEQKKREAVDSGLSASELNEAKLLEGAHNVGKQLAEFASDLGVATEPPLSPSDWRGFSSFRDAAKGELESLWSESPDVREQSQLNQARAEADSLKTEYSRHNQAVVDAKGEINTFEQEHGDQAQIDAEIQSIQEDIGAVDEEIGQVSPRAKLVEEGIAMLESAVPAEKDDLCPLCGEKVPDLLNHLKEEWTERIQSQVQDLQDKRGKFKKREDELKRLRDKHAKLSEQVQAAEAQLVASAQKIAGFLEKKKLTDRDDPVALLNVKIERASGRLETIESAIKAKRDTLNGISESLEQLGLLYDVLAFEEKIGDIEKITETDEYKELDRIMDEVANLVVDAEFLEESVRKCIREEAEGRMADAKRAIDEYFQRIVGNPGIQKLCVEIEEDKRTGGNSYRFCNESGQELNPVLSQGDLNGLALSMFLGLVEAYSHPIGFVMMDDPSQSLGTLQKKRLVEVLDAVCQSGRSIIVATMDAEVRSYLQTNLTKAKTIYDIDSWMPESGPKISGRT